MFRHQKKVRQTPPASPKETPRNKQYVVHARFLGKATIHFLWVIAMLMWRIPTSLGRWREIGPWILDLDFFVEVGWDFREKLD